MGFLNWFRKHEARELDHPEFGHLRYSERHQSWVNENFAFWGYSGLQLVIDGDASGPTAAQFEALRDMQKARDQLLPRCLSALTALPELEGSVGSTFVLAGLSVPRLDDSESGLLWNLWFDKEGDEHYMFGVQSTDSWRTLQAHVGD
jgi:hypothetical protein